MGWTTPSPPSGGVAVRTLRFSGAALRATPATAAHDAANRTDARSRSSNGFTVATVENSSRRPRDIWEWIDRIALTADRELRRIDGSRYELRLAPMPDPIYRAVVERRQVPVMSRQEDGRLDRRPDYLPAGGDHVKMQAS